MMGKLNKKKCRKAVLHDVVKVRKQWFQKGSCDKGYFCGVIVDVKHGDKARVLTKAGVLKDYFDVAELSVVETARNDPVLFGLEELMKDWSNQPLININTACTKLSPTGGARRVRCSCRSGVCINARCGCYNFEDGHRYCGSHCKCDPKRCRNREQGTDNTKNMG